MIVHNHPGCGLQDPARQSTNVPRIAALLLAGCCLTAACRNTPATAADGQSAPAPALDFNAIAAHIDPYVEKPRVLVMSDIANEPDDQMSMVRFLVYSNEFDIEGLVASTSTWMRNRVRPDVMMKLIDAYEQVQPALSSHARGFPAAAAARAEE